MNYYPLGYRLVHTVRGRARHTELAGPAPREATVDRAVTKILADIKGAVECRRRFRNEIDTHLNAAAAARANYASQGNRLDLLLEQLSEARQREDRNAIASDLALLEQDPGHRAPLPPGSPSHL